MQITTFFVFCWCALLIEGNDGGTTLTDKMAVNTEPNFLRELQNVQNEFRKQDQVQQDSMSEIAKQIENQKKMIERLNANARSSSETNILTKETDTPIDPIHRYTTLGCSGDKLALSCPDTGKISVTSGHFGQYNFTCDDGCCPPGPYQDCTQAVLEAEPADWAVVLMSCQDKTECEVQYSGRSISECDSADFADVVPSDTVDADYMQIYYDCIPKMTDEAVGFTAHASKDRSYTTHETIVFDDVQSNFGGAYYNAQTSTFICPHSGVYLFSVNFNADKNVFMSIEIVRDNVVLSGAKAFIDTSLEVNSYNHADALVIVECYAGQVVWARAAGEGDLHAPEKYSQFSGYMLHRYASPQ